MNKKKILEQHYRDNLVVLRKRMTFRVGGDSALGEDVVQEAYAKAIRYLGGYDPKQEFGAWFNSILNSTLKDIQKKERGKGVMFADISVEPDGDMTITKNDLASTIGREGVRNRYILTMFFYEGFKTRQISEFLDINHNTVRQIIKRFGEKFLAGNIGGR